MRYLGIDFGLRRIGLAVSEGNLASPYKVVEGRGFTDLMEKIKRESVGFDKVVVGLPEGKMGKTVLGFVNALKKNGLDVDTTEETLSTKLAIQQMLAINIPKKKRKINDDIAAAIILQNYLDSK